MLHNRKTHRKKLFQNKNETFIAYQGGYLIKNEQQRKKNYRKLHRIFLKATADNEQTKREKDGKKVIIKCISMNVTDIRNYILFCV